MGDDIDWSREFIYWGLDTQKFAESTLQAAQEAWDSEDLPLCSECHEFLARKDGLCWDCSTPNPTGTLLGFEPLDCPTPCDDDCEAQCHEYHLPIHKRTGCCEEQS